MVAPNNAPVVTSVPLTGPNYLLGEVTNQYQPTKLRTWKVVIPGSLLGNEAQAGYAAFTADGSTVTKGASGYTLPNFLGFFENQYFQEGDPATNPYTETFGSNFLVSVCEIGSIYVYNSTAISASVSSGLKVVLTVTTGTTPAAIIVGAIIQGSDPSGATTLDISTVCRVRFAQTTVGGGVLVDVLKN